jgi:hypothetical protein
VVAGQKPTDFRAERFDRESKRVTVIVGPGGDARACWRALLS